MVIDLVRSVGSANVCCRINESRVDLTIVDLSIERLSGEVSHAHSSKTQSKQS